MLVVQGAQESYLNITLTDTYIYVLLKYSLYKKRAHKIIAK